MMPWWSWLIIWTFLIGGLLGMLAYFAVSLFRRLLATADELSVLSQRAEELLAASDALAVEPPQPPAIFRDRAELQHEVERRRYERLVRAQLRRDARIRRAKMLASTPPN